MNESQYTIAEWAMKTFGYPTSFQVILNRMLQEVEELEKIDYRKDDTALDKIADECADIYIVMCQIMSMINCDLQTCVDRKMETNRARKWNLNGDGTAQHVKE